LLERKIYYLRMKSIHTGSTVYEVEIIKAKHTA